MLSFIHSDGCGFAEEARAPADREKARSVVLRRFQSLLQVNDG